MRKDRTTVMRTVKELLYGQKELTLHHLVNVVATIHESMALAWVHVQGHIFIAARLDLFYELLDRLQSSHMLTFNTPMTNPTCLKVAVHIQKSTLWLYQSKHNI